MPRDLDRFVVEGLAAFHSKHGHIFPDHQHTYRGKRLRISLIALLTRARCSRPPVEPAIIEGLRALGCPLDERMYSFERKLYALEVIAHETGLAGVPAKGDLRLFMRSLQTPEGRPAPHVTPAVRVRLEALPGWNWAKTPRRRRAAPRTTKVGQERPRRSAPAAAPAPPEVGRPGPSRLARRFW